GGVEGAGDGVVGERGGIALGGEQELRLEGGRRGSKRGDRRGDGESERHGDARCGHGIVLPRPPPPISSSAVPPARDRRGKIGGGRVTRVYGPASPHPASLLGPPGRGSGPRARA